jgi:hypothetical protein
MNKMEPSSGRTCRMLSIPKKEEGRSSPMQNLQSHDIMAGPGIEPANRIKHHHLQYATTGGSQNQATFWPWIIPQELKVCGHGGKKSSMSCPPKLNLHRVLFLGCKKPVRVWENYHQTSCLGKPTQQKNYEWAAKQYSQESNLEHVVFLTIYGANAAIHKGT